MQSTPDQRRTDDEIAADVRVRDPRYPELDVRRYGAVPNISTAAQRALNDSAFADAMQVAYQKDGQIYISPGAWYKSDTIDWYNGVSFRTEGASNTQILMNDHTLPIFRVNTTTCPPGSGSLFSTNNGVGLSLYGGLWLRYESTPTDKYTYTSAVGILVDGVSINRFRIDELYFYNGYAAIRAINDASMWKGIVKHLEAVNCYKCLEWIGDGVVTTFEAKIAAATCFHGLDLEGFVYCNVSFNHDSGGLNGASSFGPSTEVPKSLHLNSCHMVMPYLGTEQNDSMLMHLEGYSHLDVRTWFFTSTAANIWAKDAGRTSNIALAEQGFITADQSTFSIDTFNLILRTSSGYPAATTTDTNFITIVDATDDAYGAFKNGFLEIECYYFVDSSHEALWREPDNVLRLGSERITFETMMHKSGIRNGTTTELTIENTEDRVAFSSTDLGSSNQNNFAPHTFLDENIVEIYMDASVNITGFAGGFAGCKLHVINIDGTQTGTIKHEDSNSDAGNRVHGPGNADVALGPREGAILRFSGTQSRWYVSAN